MKLAKSLCGKLRMLQNATIVFDSEKRCFAESPTGKKKRGLTKMLSRMMPVPQSSDAAARGSAVVHKRVRRFDGSIMARCSTCVAAVAVARKGADELGQRLQRERNGDRAHGVLVDHQLALYVRDGRKALFQKCESVDPCVGALIEQLDDEGLALIASQIPIYCSQINIATAIDLLATDRASGEKLILIEIKATKAMTESAIAEYEATRGVMVGGAMKGLPLSYHARHQTQLLCMQQMLLRQHGIAVDESRVMRVSPGLVHTYALERRYAERRDKLFLAIARNMQKRASRKRKASK